jgi:hypothetical protein
MMPLALYLLYLSYLHQRRQPTLITGPWDFACALMGLSGFLLVGGVMIVSVVDSTWRNALFKGSFKTILMVWKTDPGVWSMLSGGYVLILVMAITLLMRQRRKWIMIYNADRALVEDALIGVLESHGYAWKRTGNGLEIGPTKDDHERFHAAVQMRVQIHSFESMHHVGLRWLTRPTLRQTEIVGELEKALAGVDAPESAVAGWFLTAAVSIFFVMLLWMIFLIYTVLRGP